MTAQPEANASIDPASEKWECSLTGKPYPRHALLDAERVEEAVLQLMQNDHPVFTGKGLINRHDYVRYWVRHLAAALERQDQNLTAQQQLVIDALEKGYFLHPPRPGKTTDQLTLGQRLADKISAFGGSWAFISSFLSVMTVWIIVNGVWLGSGRAFDPYPFILLNLALSCLAAIQAPLILMSQNRQSQIDREHAEYDYQVNLKAELEIRHLNRRLTQLQADVHQVLHRDGPAAT